MLFFSIIIHRQLLQGATNGEKKSTHLHKSNPQLTEASVRRAATNQGLQITFKGTGKATTSRAVVKNTAGQVVSDVTFNTDQSGLNKAINTINALRTDKTNTNVHKGQKKDKAHAR